LKVGGVFTDDLIETVAELQARERIDAIRLARNPYEFALYYDI